MSSRRSLRAGTAIVRLAAGGANQAHVLRVDDGDRWRTFGRLTREDVLQLALIFNGQLVNRFEEERAARGELELARQGSIRGARTRTKHVVVLRLELRAAHEDERAFSTRAEMQRVRDGVSSRAGRPDEEQRLAARRFPCDRVAQSADRRALPDERAVHAAARLVQEIFRDAQLALERRRPFRDPRFERRIGGLQRLRRAPALVVELCVPDRAGDLIGDDRHQAAIVRIECLPNRALDRKHSHQLVANEEGDGDLALGVGQTGHRHDVADFRGASRLHHLAALRRGVGALLPQIAQLHHLPLLRDDADGADPDLDAAADRLALVAAAGDDTQRLAVGLEQENDRVVRFEQLAHRPERDVVDLLEVERGIDLAGDALQDLELRRLAGDLRRRILQVVTVGRGAFPPTARDRCRRPGA